MATQDTEGKKLFVGGVSWTTSDTAFSEFFGKFGEITDAVIMRNIDGRSRGFGFVTFKNPADADKVIASQERELDGRQLDCKSAVPKEAIQSQPRGGNRGGDPHQGGPRTCKIFVGGVSPETSKEDFLNHFSKYGRVTDAIIMTDRDTGRSRGFGFVTFETEESVEKVISVSVHILSDKQVDCKKAVPKQDQGGGFGGGGSFGGNGGFGGGGPGGFQGNFGGRGGGGGYGGGGYGGPRGYMQQGGYDRGPYGQGAYDQRGGDPGYGFGGGYGGGGGYGAAPYGAPGGGYGGGGGGYGAGGGYGGPQSNGGDQRQNYGGYGAQNGGGPAGAGAMPQETGYQQGFGGNFQGQGQSQVQDRPGAQNYGGVQ